VRYKFGDRAPEVAIPDPDNPIDFLDRPHETFRVRIGIRYVFWNQHDAEARLPQPPPRVAAPFSIAITDQHRRWPITPPSAIVSVRTTVIDTAVNISASDLLRRSMSPSLLSR
jgi:hypothetical protein